VQNHAADQLDIEVPHVENAAAALAHHSEGFDQKLIEDFVDQLGTLGVEFLAAILVRIGLVRNSGQAFLYSLPELVRLGAQLLIRELAHFGLKRVDGFDTRHQALDIALVLRSENLCY
jgi:hypothetical protein